MKKIKPVTLKGKDFSVQYADTERLSYYFSAKKYGYEFCIEMCLDGFYVAVYKNKYLVYQKEKINFVVSDKEIDFAIKHSIFFTRKHLVILGKAVDKANCLLRKVVEDINNERSTK